MAIGTRTRRGGRDALKQFWAGRWVARGYLGYFGKKLGEDRLFLDTQPLGVLAGMWDAAQRTAMFDAIDELCVTPQKVGVSAASSKPSLQAA